MDHKGDGSRTISSIVGCKRRMRQSASESAAPSLKVPKKIHTSDDVSQGPDCESSASINVPSASTKNEKPASAEALPLPEDSRYFEMQDGAWCGMHALNNYKGGPYIQKEDCRRAAVHAYNRLSKALGGDAKITLNILTQRPVG